jgi:hypothetical protein
MSEDELVFVGAAILLAQMVGLNAELSEAGEKRIGIAVSNARNLRAAIKKSIHEDPVRQTLGLMDHDKRHPAQS